MITCKEFWNKRAQIYDDLVGTMYEETNRLTAQRALKYLKPDDRVLDFACGTGLITLQVAPHVAQVRAIDISDQMVQRFQTKLNTQHLNNVELSQTDLFDPCLEPGSFDAVLACNVLCYVENFQTVMARIQELLKPGGYFLSATDCLGQKWTKEGVQKFFRSHTGKMPYVAFFRNKGLEQRIAAAGFTVLETDVLYPAPPNLFVAAKL